jgi:hypothetical protein
MERVIVYLRTPLFSIGGADAHLPSDVRILEGALISRDSASLRIDADRMLDTFGREVLDEAITLVIPWEKIDHVVVVA